MIASLPIAAALVVGALVGGATDPPEPRPVSKVVVRYSEDAPVKRSDGKPWGVQCVDARYRERLAPGRSLGAGMYIVRLQPPVSHRVALRIARQLDACPGVVWAEPSTVVFGPRARPSDST